MIVSRDQASHKLKHGVDMWVYPTDREEIGFLYDEVNGGHFQEFMDKVSTFAYYILDGHGTFFLNGTPHEAGSGDLIIVPPMTKLYYLGTMKMILVTTPAWKAENEVHVRDIPSNSKLLQLEKPSIEWI